MVQNGNKISGKYNLNPQDLEFFRLCFKYHDKGRAYKETRPNCTDNKDSIRTNSCRLYSQISAKFDGNIRDMFEAAGLGANRLTDEIEKGLNAKSHVFYEGVEVKKVPDNASRDRNKVLLANIMGWNNKTVEVHKEPSESIDLSKLDEEQLKSLQKLLSIAKVEKD
jgi:hypothetical protein